MRIRGITVHAANMAAERKSQESRHQAQREEGMFGASCRVTISQEGRKRSGQQAAGVRQETVNVSSEKRLLRLQKTDDQYENTRNGYLEELEEIDDKINELNNSFTGKKDFEETIGKQQKVLRAMRNQKQHQLEENQRREREARQMAMQSGKYQEEIDENNRDLRTLLKSIEEAEKAEDELKNREAEGGKSDGGKSDAENSAGSVIRNSAVQFTASSVRREWDVQEMIAGLGGEGHRFLDQADSITQAVLRENEKLRAALEAGTLTEEEMTEQTGRIRERIAGNYKDVEDFRGWGMQILSDTLDCKLQHIADDPLKGMEETKKSMMLSAMDAAVHDVVQGKLDETSGKLEKEVEELIDERNNVDRIQNEEEEKEEQEKSSDEILQLEDAEEGGRELQQ